MYTTIKVIGLLLLFGLPGKLLFAQKAIKPFPQHVHYSNGVIKPGHVSQQQMDDSVRSFYNSWKERYINDDSGEGQYYIWAESSAGKAQCISEGQGYGMIIVALMAGYDTAGQHIYNG
jgi:endoglucanase